ncbi:hypothetical protein [uncultured Methanospirillum sp.]|uniref:hypothetical protein n=1 Tax=uncultured Methanospirillum sp. TaxID=262503 RepID=UPI0029C747F4|nr:hypothetical protein [uncultured Methanospirillum sp.]
MQWNHLLAGSLLLILASLTGAEYLGTTISTDGVVILTGSDQDGNGSVASRIMAIGTSELSRIIGDEGGIGMTVQGRGPLLFSDHTTGTTPTQLGQACVFLTPDRINADSRANLDASGILSSGIYAMTRVPGRGISGETLVNGSGIMLLRSGSDGNRTTRSTGFVSGNMTLHDLTRY